MLKQSCRLPIGTLRSFLISKDTDRVVISTEPPSIIIKNGARIITNYSKNDKSVDPPSSTPGVDGDMHPVSFS